MLVAYVGSVRTVPPALVLAAQLIMGLLFGVLGLFLADPLMAMLKVALERRAEESQKEDARYHAA